MKIPIQDIFLRLMFNIQKNCVNFIMVYPFCQKELKTEKVEKFVANMLDEKEYVIQNI